MPRKRVAVVLAVAASASLSLISPAQATHSWNNYHWARTASAFTLPVGNQLAAGADWHGHLATSVADWSSSTTLKLSAAPSTSTKRCSMVKGTVQVCASSYGRNGWLGLASISVSGGHITQGSAKMNDTYFSMATYNNPNEKLHVMCQEIGHTFGLGHTSEDGSSQNTCMDYFSNTGPHAASTVSTHPNAHDFEQIATMYAHLDASTTVAATPTSSARNEVGVERSTWGQEVERGEHGEFSIFVREFGYGEKVITHVTWA